jgi:sialate O-acetylesterase
MLQRRAGTLAHGVVLGLGILATRVRFCWGDSPLCNLYDGSGLPVGPFEIDIK